MSKLNVDGYTSFVRQRVRSLITGYGLAAATPNRIRCEFCDRGYYLSDDETCKGCGAPIPASASDSYLRSVSIPAVTYQTNAISQEDLPFLGRPGVNIPVNVPQHSRISDFINAGAMVGASMLGRTRF